MSSKLENFKPVATQDKTRKGLMKLNVAETNERERERERKREREREKGREVRDRNWA